MYKQIENKFKIGSKERTNKILFAVFTLIVALITAVPLAKTNAPIWSLIVAGVGDGVLLYIGTYCYIFIHLKRKKIKDVHFFNIENVIAHYQDEVHQKDLDLLYNITKDYNIDTIEKLQEAIRHYQNLLPRKVISGGTWLSICALSVSIAAFITVESQTTITAHLEVLIAVLVALTVIYFVFKVIGQELLQKFGKHAMYERLEAALSELYFTASIDEESDGEENATEQKENE